MKHFKPVRVLAIAPSTKGFGYAVMEESAKFVDWGVKPASGHKNAHSLAKLDELMAHYLPATLVLEDDTAPDVRRGKRIRTLCTQIAALAKRRKVKVKRLTRTRVRKAFFGDDAPGSKQALAELLARQFPEQLASRLPTKRKLWTSQDYRMDIFDAVALALVFQLSRRGDADVPAVPTTRY